MKMKSCIAGIDFGTTSLSAVVVNLDDIQIEKSFCYNTNAYITFSDPFRKEQSIEILTELFYRLLDDINNLPGIKITAYGFTGQMHGIIGLDRNKKTVTNLVTWQDRSGELMLPDGISLLEKVKQLSENETVANGYGIITLFKWIHYDKRTDIDSFCTVADYFAMSLANSNTITMSPSMAHSIGFYDINSNHWNMKAIQGTDLEVINFPIVKANPCIVGYAQASSGSIPVISALGDNQASFLGSVIRQKESILLNVGTGTQLSFLIHKSELDIYRKYVDGYDTQLRPFDDSFYLIATGFLNGGSVYKSLFNFFKEVGLSLLELQEIDETKLWKNMQKYGEESLELHSSLLVIPLLEGLRKNGNLTGSISNINSSNFHPGELVAGFLKGLATHYKTGYFPELQDRTHYICGSGNGLKRNSLFTKLIEQTFECPLFLTSYEEEAATGAAINAAMTTGIIKNEAEREAFLSKISPAP